MNPTRCEEKIFFKARALSTVALRYQRRKRVMTKHRHFDLQGRRAAAEKRETQQQMLRDWDAIRASLPEVDAQFIKETR